MSAGMMIGTVNLVLCIVLLCTVSVDGLDASQDVWPLIYTKKSDGEPAFDIVEEPIPPECNLQPNTDYDGSAIRWGHRPAPPVRSAAECCRMCLNWTPRLGKTCDAWVRQRLFRNGSVFVYYMLARVLYLQVFCADPSGECWLKHQEGWNGDPATLVENARGDYPEEWLKMHQTSPPRVAWTAGYRSV